MALPNVVYPQFKNPVRPLREPGGENIQGLGKSSSEPIINACPQVFSNTNVGVASASQIGVPMAEITREEIDAKLAASEARADTKIAMLSGKLDTLEATLGGKLDNITGLMLAKFTDVENDIHKTDSYNRDSRLIMLASLLASVLALAALIIGMATYGDAMFGRGMNVRNLIHQMHQESQPVKPHG